MPRVSVTRDQIIVHAGITNEPIDTNQLVPALEGIKENPGEYPKAALADTRFNSGPDLTAMETRRIDAYLRKERMNEEKHQQRTQACEFGVLSQGGLPV